jgi:hypothetical protein
VSVSAPSQRRRPKGMHRENAFRSSLPLGLLVPIALLTVAGCTSGPPGPGQFGRTGDMVNDRHLSTATSLADGRVLMAGGEDHNGAELATAEIYTPATGKFSPTGSMTAPRQQQTATVLANGQVLVTGGRAFHPDGASMASAELYDPTTGTFKATGSMSQGRFDFTATLLPNGKVLIAGGYDYLKHVSLASAELFDPATGTFSPTGSMTEPRDNHTATLLKDGRILVAGGSSTYETSPYPTSDGSAELYDPTSGTFSKTGPMGQPRASHTATLLDNGRVLIVEGSGDDSAELYDPVSATFKPTGSLGHYRYHHTATLLLDGGVLITSGYAGSWDYMDQKERPTGELGTLASAEIFDPATGTFSPTGSMATARYGATANLLPDGRVLIAGGYDGNPSAEIYQP